MEIEAFRGRFEDRLSAFLEEKRAIRRLTKDAFVREVLAYPEALLAQGKRVRPYMAWLMYGAAGGRDEGAVMHLGIALELFHMFGLVHDDIIDHGQVRHGVPTAHRHVAARLRDMRRLGDVPHVAEGQAMLIGDLLYTWAFDALLGVRGKASSQVQGHFITMAEEVLVGQVLDVDLTTRREADRRLIDDKMSLKTASYTFVRPMRMGAALAGADTRLGTFCEEFGSALGLAFQIQDDLLDLVAASAKTGKTGFSDLAERQHTVFTQYVYENGTPSQVRLLRRVHGNPATERDKERIRGMFEASGAFAHGKRRMERHFARARALLSDVRLDAPSKQALSGLVSYIEGRSA